MGVGVFGGCVWWVSVGVVGAYACGSGGSVVSMYVRLMTRRHDTLHC